MPLSSVVAVGYKLKSRLARTFTAEDSNRCIAARHDWACDWAGASPFNLTQLSIKRFALRAPSVPQGCLESNR